MQSKLHLAATQLGLPLSTRASADLLEYLNLLYKWNAAYNLTAIRELDKMLVYHLLDSLAIAPFVEGDKILDVGTGGGLPGLVLAIVQPNRSFTLLDANGKKTRFLQQVRRSLRLDNVEIVQERVEKLQTRHCYDMITSRAFAQLHNMVAMCAPQLGNNGIMAAMKGRQAADELATAQRTHQLDNVQIHKISVPFMNEERNLVMFKLRQE